MKKNSKKTVLIAGGGTGGHLYPALSIGAGLNKENITVKYVGSKFGIEKKIYKKLHLKYYLLNIKGIQRNYSLKSFITNLSFPFKFLISYIHSLIIILNNKPSVIIGTGGYSSGLPLLAGIHLKIPTVIQDQNSIPGLITKKLSSKVTKICLEYECATPYLNNEKCIITGNPIREKLKLIDKLRAKNTLGFSNKKTILILGGSQGSSPINKHIKNSLRYYKNNDIQIIWQCGEKDFKFLKNECIEKAIIITPFISDMSKAYSAADLVISRAGALSISEMTYMKKAMILIPFPFAAENHQYFNAENIKNKKACILIEQNKLDTGILEDTIDDLFKNNDKLEKLEKNSSDISFPDSTSRIVNEIIGIMQ